MNKILILGGYGNFGWRISTALAKDNIPIIIAGRNENQAIKLAHKLQAIYPNATIETAGFDVNKELAAHLQSLRPLAVVNTAGPFQNADYIVAEACITAGVHYIDLADGRDFVRDIISLDEKAKANNVLIVSGASTVPGLSSAVLEKYKEQFLDIKLLFYGISPGQKADRGLATTKAILTYVGKPLKPAFNSSIINYGWQGIYRQDYPVIGKRWMANCDIPDLDLLPELYGIKNISFSAGMENTLLHLGIWLTSWLIRIKLPLNLPKYAPFLLRLSYIFDIFGSADGGMHMIIRGRDKNGKELEIKWFIIARDGDGPQIPTVAAIILAKKLMLGKIKLIGALPCVGLVSLEEYIKELDEFNIKIYDYFN